MNKSYIYLILFTLASVFFVSCTQRTIKTTENTISQRFYLSPDTTKGSLYIDMDVEIPVSYSNMTILDTIRNQIVSNLFGKNYVKIPDDSLLQKFIADLDSDYKYSNYPLLNQMDNSNQYSFDNEHRLQGFTVLNDKKIFTYGIDRYVFMGGAHGLKTLHYFNFDLKTGKRITEKDIFIPGYEQKLSDLIKTRIVEQSKEDENTEPITNLDNTDYWVDAIKPNGNFYITDESINYIFNPYEIAPYYMGQTEVDIPFERLKDLWKPNNIIMYLVNKAKN